VTPFSEQVVAADPLGAVFLGVKVPSRQLLDSGG